MKTVFLVLFSSFIVTSLQTQFKNSSGNTAAADNDIIISYEDHIEIINGSDTKVIESFSLSPTINYIVGVTTDGLDHNMYLSDLRDSGMTIFKVSLNENHQIKPIVKKNSLEMVESVAYERSENYLFFSDSKKKRILKSYLGNESSQPEDVVIFNQEDKLHGVAVDSCQRKLYWVNWNSKDPKIEHSNLDGSERTILFNSNLSKPYSLIIDNWERKLYWIDVNKNGNFKIERDSLDYHDNREVVCWGSGNSPYSMTVSREHVYWSDWQNSVIWRIQKHGSDCVPTAVKRLSSSRPMGIATLSEPDSCISPTETTKPPSTKMSDKEFVAESATTLKSTTVDDSMSDNNCQNYCLHGTCSLTSINIPICTCFAGFAGSRCHNDLCHNYCLNGGICVLEGSNPTCRCQKYSLGSRCQNIQKGDEELNNYLSKEDLYLFLFIGLTVTSVIVIGILSLFVHLYRRKSLYRSHHKSSPVVVKAKRNRVISGSKQDKKSSTCSVELEDCCNMTLCDTPCVESASFRKARHRGRSINEDDDDDKNLLLDNDHLNSNKYHINKNEDLF